RFARVVVRIFCGVILHPSWPFNSNGRQSIAFSWSKSGRNPHCIVWRNSHIVYSYHLIDDLVGNGLSRNCSRSRSVEGALLPGLFHRRRRILSSAWPAHCRDICNFFLLQAASEMAGYLRHCSCGCWRVELVCFDF